MTVRKIVKSLIVNSKNEILLLKRSDYKGPSSQHFWDLPGGSVDMGELPLDAMIRECNEELGIVLVKFDLFSKHFGSYSNNTFFQFSLFVCDIGDTNLKIKLSHEHVDFTWVGLESLDQYKTKSEKITLNNIVEFLKKR